MQIILEPTVYHFSVLLCQAGQATEISLGSLQTRYLSSEVAGGFTGVMAALYAQDENAEDGRTTEPAVFRDFEMIYAV